MSGIHIFLLIVFVCHLVPFGMLYVKRGDLKYLLLCGIFINLILWIILQEFPPAPIEIGQWTLAWSRLFRLIAWGFTASVILYYLVHFLHPNLENPSFKMFRTIWNSLRGKSE